MGILAIGARREVGLPSVEGFCDGGGGTVPVTPAPDGNSPYGE